MTVEFHQLLEGLKLQNTVVSTKDDQAIMPEQLLKNTRLMYEAQLKLGQIPEFYDTPIGAQLELTTRCNQKCIQCYNASGTTEEVNLSIEEWKKVAHQLGKMGIFQCVISGGEPLLLGEGLFEILDVLHSYGIKLILISNGMLIDQKMISRLSKYEISWFQISIDGSRPEIHDLIRGAKSWYKALNAANLVREAGMPLVVAHTVVNANFDYLREMIDMAYLLGAFRFSFGAFQLSGRAISNYTQLALTDEQINQINEIANYKIIEYRGRMQVAMVPEESLAFRLRALQTNGIVLVRPNGDVKFDCTAPFTIGNVREEKIIDIWQSIGKKVWQHPRVVDYILSIKNNKDMLTVKPRVYVDPDEKLEVVNG